MCLCFIFTFFEPTLVSVGAGGACTTVACEWRGEGVLEPLLKVLAAVAACSHFF